MRKLGCSWRDIINHWLTSPLCDSTMQFAGSAQCLAVSLASVGACLLIYLKRHGLFQKLRMEKKNLGGYVVIYENFVGPYKNVAPIFHRISKLGKQYLGHYCLTCGFYFDDPDKVPGSKCRTSVGAIIFQGVDEKGLLDAKNKALEHPVVKHNNLKVGIFPETKSLSIDFPFHGMLSILIGVKRCYPELMKHCEFGTGNVCCSMEVYDPKNHEMFFTVPLEDRQDMLPFEIEQRT